MARHRSFALGLRIGNEAGAGRLRARPIVAHLGQFHGVPQGEEPSAALEIEPVFDLLPRMRR